MAVSVSPSPEYARPTSIYCALFEMKPPQDQFECRRRKSAISRWEEREEPGNIDQLAGTLGAWVRSIDEWDRTAIQETRGRRNLHWEFEETISAQYTIDETTIEKWSKNTNTPKNPLLIWWNWKSQYNLIDKDLSSLTYSRDKKIPRRKNNWNHNSRTKTS